MFFGVGNIAVVIGFVKREEFFTDLKVSSFVIYVRTRVCIYICVRYIRKFVIRFFIFLVSLGYKVFCFCFVGFCCIRFRMSLYRGVYGCGVFCDSDLDLFVYVYFVHKCDLDYFWLYLYVKLIIYLVSIYVREELF